MTDCWNILKGTIRDFNLQIQECDQEIKSNGNVDLYIDERNRLEKENAKWEREIEQDQKSLGDLERRLRTREKKSETISDANSEVEMYKKQCPVPVERCHPYQRKPWESQDS